MQESDDVFAIGALWYELLMGRLGHHIPVGQAWNERRGELKIRGMSDQQLDLLEGCLKPSREHQVPNAIRLRQLIRSTYDDRASAHFR
jgi:hypothetical protein